MILTKADSNDTYESDKIVEAHLQRLKDFATLPETAAEVMRLANDPVSTAEDISQVITKDPALSIRVLKVVNSSFYGMSRQVDSIQQAVTLLGLNAVKNIAIAGSVRKLFQAGEICDDFDPYDLWSHSIAVATGAREIACKTRDYAPDEAFLAGMIHDLGIMIEMQVCREEFIKAIELLDADPSLSFRQAERQAIGATHEAFGAGLCQKWKFPVSIGNVAGYHHQPMQLPEADRLLPAMVHVADVLAARIGIGYTRTVEAKAIDPEILSFLNLNEADLEAFIETLPDVIEEAQLLLSGNEAYDGQGTCR